MQLSAALPDFDGWAPIAADMFEGKPPVARKAQEIAPGPYADEELYALSWGDLSARLSAARELCEVLSSLPHVAHENGAASFGQIAAGHLDEAVGKAKESGEHAVNLEGSSNCKANDGTSGASTDAQHLITRGSQ